MKNSNYQNINKISLLPEKSRISLNMRRVSKVDVNNFQGFVNKTPSPLKFQEIFPKFSPEPSPVSGMKYLAYRTYRGKKNSGKTDERLEKKHQEFNKRRLAEVRFKEILDSKVRYWNLRKSKKDEEFVRNIEQARQIKNITPDPREDCYSDEEDFSYSFLTKVGSIRKHKRDLLHISRKPDYLGAANYISIQPHSIYSLIHPVRSEDRTEQVQEAFLVKKALAEREIPFPIHQISGTIYPNLPKSLPKGGELLLKA